MILERDSETPRYTRIKQFTKNLMLTEKLGLGPIKKMLKSIGGWPVLEAEKWNESKFTWMDTMYKLQGVAYFFELKVAPDYNVKENILYVSYSTLIQ